jgi:hypothetical protein
MSKPPHTHYDLPQTQSTDPVSEVRGDDAAIAKRAPQRALRDERGRVLPGQSINPNGRPKGVAALARDIRRRVGEDGAAMNNFVESIWRGWKWDPDTGEIVVDDAGRPVRDPVPADDARKWQALQWLSDRGFGKPVIAVDVQAMVAQYELDAESAGTGVLNVAALGDEELEDLTYLVARAAGEVASRPRPRLALLDVDAIELQDEPVDAVEPHDEVGGDSVDEVLEEDGERVHHAFTNSSNVDRLVFDPARGALTVHFKGDRGVYEYGNVTPALVDELIAAPSAGKWLGANLKARPALFPCRKIAGDA